MVRVIRRPKDFVSVLVQNVWFPPFPAASSGLCKISLWNGGLRGVRICHLSKHGGRPTSGRLQRLPIEWENGHHLLFGQRDIAEASAADHCCAGLEKDCQTVPRCHSPTEFFPFWIQHRPFRSGYCGRRTSRMQCPSLTRRTSKMVCREVLLESISEHWLGRGRRDRRVDYALRRWAIPLSSTPIILERLCYRWDVANWRTWSNRSLELYFERIRGNCHVGGHSKRRTGWPNVSTLHGIFQIYPWELWQLPFGGSFLLNVLEFAQTFLLWRIHSSWWIPQQLGPNGTELGPMPILLKWLNLNVWSCYRKQIQVKYCKASFFVSRGGLVLSCLIRRQMESRNHLEFSRPMSL